MLDLSPAENANGPGVSVCVLTANRTALLQRLLEALRPQLTAVDDVIILDTDPNDANQRLVEDFHDPRLRYNQFAQETFDFATARNELLRLAQGRSAVFIDDDAIPHPTWLALVRSNLKEYDAVGGVTVCSAKLPDWWDYEINWCVGLSPPGTVLGHPGYYPDTCNLGATAKTWRQHPFEVVARRTRNLYATGREDAEWWVERRVHGDNVTVDYKQAVLHEVHPDRINWNYVIERAKLDGLSSWLRKPSFEGATAIPWDMAHIAGVVLDKVLSAPLQRKRWVGEYIWMMRQWGRFKAIWRSPLEQRPIHRELVRELARAAAFQGRLRAGRVAFRAIKAFRRPNAYPPPAPRLIFVSADCLVGDSILLRPHIHTLAKSFPGGEVLVSARYPQLLSGLAENITVVETSKASAAVTARRGQVSAAIIPYFHHGDYKLWRSHLSQIGTTFDCDVGFPGRRDYIYARRRIVKNLELHEHENLARLFRLWPLSAYEFPDGPKVDVQHEEWLRGILRSNGITRQYIIVQFGAGYAAKEWPLDCWIPFLNGFGREIQIPIIIIGSDNWADAAEIARRETEGIVQLVSMVGKTNLDQLMTLIKHASFFIGGCSGPKHLAMDYHVPTFTLYTATEPHRWGASRDHELHAYVNSFSQKLTGMELHGLRDDHRPRLLRPEFVLEKALAHYRKVMRQEQDEISVDLPG